MGGRKEERKGEEKKERKNKERKKKRKGKEECFCQWTTLITTLYIGKSTSLNCVTNQCSIIAHQFKFYKLMFSYL